MPVYEFQCRSCGHKFMQLTLSLDSAKARCPKCKSQDVKRLFSSFASTSTKSTNGCSPSG